MAPTSFTRAQSFRRTLALTLALSAALGVLTTALPNFRLRQSLPFSLCIGLSIFLVSWGFKLARGVTALDWKSSMAAVPIGVLIGTVTGSLAAGFDPWRMLRDHPDFLMACVALSLVFGTAVSYYFYSRGALAEADAARRQEELARLAYERQLAEANLKMLQAQIEPHFLFNSLSNVLGLIAVEPRKAERMLQDLTDYLRASLLRTRSGRVTLAEELELVRAQLGIQSVRMGSRLRYAIEVAPGLGALELPPLILQPIVENAIEHGLEPSAEGGEVRVAATRVDGSLLLEVRDTGVGFSPDAGPGVGLGNVRSRLEAVYRGRASLTVQPLAPRGVRVRIAIPLDAPAEGG
jgi:signal transduction histidine kinase